MEIPLLCVNHMSKNIHVEVLKFLSPHTDMVSSYFFIT